MANGTPQQGYFVKIRRGKGATVGLVTTERKPP